MGGLTLSQGAVLRPGVNLRLLTNSPGRETGAPKVGHYCEFSFLSSPGISTGMPS